ncbi:hypothetical protein K7X08_009840 [Anisodus acutangulus]|uniref:Uncharacterized protein n=1 Tax=Anisodus acutangulus TaxID=402998 RepID=A0A9Q1N079_9SOLA|nr:hypothetical protein K7X08_009840 [Anisodus acutangulus]
MGFGRGFTFILGSLCGVYVAQHYRVPRIGEYVHSGCVKARELEQAYRRPENFSPNEGHRAHDCWFRARYHERNYHRPENFCGNEVGEKQNNKAVHPNWSRPMTLDTNEAREEQYNNKALHQDRARSMNLDGTYNRPEIFDPNEVHEKHNKNKVTGHLSWIRPMDLNKPYNNNGPKNSSPNEADQE